MHRRGRESHERKAGKRNAARVLTWLAAGGVFILVAGGSIAYLVLFPPISAEAPTPAATLDQAKQLGIALTPEAMDAISPAPDDRIDAALATLAGNRDWSDRGDFAYLLRHGAEGDTAEVLLRSYGKQVAATETLFDETKPFCFFPWRISTAADPSSLQAVSLATQIVSLQVLVDAKNGATDQALGRLKRWTSMLGAWPTGMTPVEGLQRASGLRQALICVVRAAESRPHDAAFRERLLAEVVQPLPSPDPRPVLRANASVVALFARQQAGLEGTEYPESMQTRFNSEWAFAPGPVRMQVLKGAQEEILRQNVAVIDAVEKGWPYDVTAGEAEAKALEPAALKPTTVSPKDSYKNMLLSSSVSYDTIMRACRSVAVYRDLVAAYLRLAAFHDSKGRWPSTLEEAGVTTIDLYSGEPLGYRTDGGTRIWSVGADRMDDNGRPRMSLSGGQGDIVLSLDRYGHFQFAGN